MIDLTISPTLNWLSSIFDYVIGTIKDVLSMFVMLAKTALQLPSFFSWIPNEIYSFLAVMFSIVILYKIIGREG